METRDFESIAEHIADSLMGGIPLNDSIKRKADELSLNPEQIKRLVEFSNRAAFQKHYKDLDNRSDMEFDVADAEKILDDIYGPDSHPESDEDSEEASEEDNDPFADIQDKHLELKETLHPIKDEKKEKEAREKIASSIYPEEYSEKSKFEIKDLPRLKKIAEELKYKMVGLEYRYWDSLKKLAEVFTHYYDPVDYNDFEKTATYVGESALPVLKDLRTVTKKNIDAPLKLDTAKYYQVKTANEAKAQSLFKESLSLNQQQLDNVDALHYINCKIAGVEQWLKQPA